jgi:alkylation response protein AidB-like acyl-CoA dehydrogenase
MPSMPTGSSAWCARTPTPASSEGISFLLIDMATPGLTVRPIVGIHGWHLFNQVFLDGVKVPVENRVGEENQGWTIAKSLLEFERLNLARVAENRRRLAKARSIGEEVREAGVPLPSGPGSAPLRRTLGAARNAGRHRAALSTPRRGGATPDPRPACSSWSAAS